VNRVDHTEVYRTFTRSALSGREPSLFSTQVLLRRGLEERWEEEPAAVIADIRGAGAGLRADLLFVLAELSFSSTPSGGGAPSTTWPPRCTRWPS
jgi:hypothetical protein